ncbi:MAG: hypothetical protein ABIP53_00120 [Candidatus Limnocylindrales bacterium]
MLTASAKRMTGGEALGDALEGDSVLGATGDGWSVATGAEGAAVEGAVLRDAAAACVAFVGPVDVTPPEQAPRSDPLSMIAANDRTALLDTAMWGGIWMSSFIKIRSWRYG